MRISTYLFGAASAFGLALAIGCGTPGAPLPPSLELPTPVDDLAATRKGNTVVLIWTPSRRTTDKQNIRRPGVSRVCRVADELSITQCANVIAEIAPDRLPKPTEEQPRPQFRFVDQLPQSVLSERGFATYAVEMLNQRGRSAGLSNQVRVPLAPTPPAPEELSTMVTAEGVTIAWKSERRASSNSLRLHYRLFRRPAGQGRFTLVEDVPLSGEGTAIPDKSFEWEQTYEYKVTPVTDVLENGREIAVIEGDDSPIVKVTVHDTFPPGQTEGLQAVYSGAGQKPFIDLTWAPNTESDLAGYDVFRREQGSEPAKVNTEIVKSSAYRDERVQPDKKYFYSVRAVDLRGNAGPVSTEASEIVPPETKEIKEVR